MHRYLKDTSRILFVISESMLYMMPRHNSLPGSTRFFSISVPVAVALMRQTCAFSRASWPWSPHSLKIHQRTVWGDNRLVNDRSANFQWVETYTVATLAVRTEKNAKPRPRIENNNNIYRSPSWHPGSFAGDLFTDTTELKGANVSLLGYDAAL